MIRRYHLNLEYKMKRKSGYMFALLLLLHLAAPVAADLVDHGPNGEYFQDTETGLYWLDPMLVRSYVRTMPDLFATHADNWDWATSAEIDALLGQASQGGINLDLVIGDRFSSVGGGGPRWLGYHSLATEPDGWLIQSTNTPDFDEITATGSQGGAAAMNPGSWFVSSVDPVIQDRLWDAGGSHEYFLDERTGFYWQDPANFAWQTRSAIQIWLEGNTDWRWATQAEVYALQGIHTHLDTDLEEIIGAPQFFPTGGKRWIGFYDQAGIPDGLILGSTVDTGNAILINAGTQGGAETWGAGAWILTETNPTAVIPTRWGSVKALYR
jgi:hypothetical protein